jgi:hemerythrin-like metal-binding protein
MNALVWSEALLLSQPLMDSTHREFVELLDRLEAALEGPLEVIDERLSLFVEHTEAHFAQEERWMGQIGFSPQNCHAFQHAHVLQVLREVLRLQREEGDIGTVRDLVGELAKWFPAHAQTMDAALAQTMAELGFDPETGAIAAALAAEAAPITACGNASCS